MRRLSSDLVQVSAGARCECLGARVEVREGVGGESLLRPGPDRGGTHCRDPGNNINIYYLEVGCER